MRSQIVTASPEVSAANSSKRNIRHQPSDFTEHGALIAANILSSPRAVTMNVYVTRLLRCRFTRPTPAGLNQVLGPTASRLGSQRPPQLLGVRT
jgi:hypothetical protein